MVEEIKEMRKRIENGRAHAAYNYVMEANDSLNNKDAENYKSYIKKMAPYIKTNGLGNTIAFYYSNASKAAYQRIYDQLEDWLKKQNLIDEDKGLVSEITGMDSRQYRHLSTETLSLLNWWRRFVDGMIETKSEE